MAGNHMLYESQIPLHYGEAYPSAEPVSQLASQLQILLQNTHVPYTERLKSLDVKLRLGSYVHK